MFISLVGYKCQVVWPRMPVAPAFVNVTPEGAVIDFDTAGLSSRILARFIDTFVQGFMLLVAGALVGGLIVTGSRTGVELAFLYVAIFLVTFGYPIVCEMKMGGRTIGKAAMGLRTVTIDGSPLKFRQSLIRSFMAIVDLTVPIGPLAGAASILTSPLHQRLGDLVANTVVLNERHGHSFAFARAFSAPPGLESYAATLDVSAITPAQYQLIRNYLLRLFDLKPGPRAALARKIANNAAAVIRHTPPPQVAPEPFLVCVVARYQLLTGPVRR